MSRRHYGGELFSPSEWELRSKEHRQWQAMALGAWRCSGDEAVDKTIHLVLGVHEGQLFDYRGHAIDKETLDLTAVFGEDAGRQIRALRKSATVPPRYRLQKRLVPRVMYLTFAVEIHHIAGGVE